MTPELEPTPDNLTHSEHPAGDQPSPPSPAIDRRREPRHVTNDPVQIRRLETGGGPPVCGNVLDVSLSGLRIELATPIEQGVQVEIVLPDGAIICGTTRYCGCTSHLYQVGVAIEVVDYAQPLIADHIQDTQLNLCVVGKGLTVLEAIYVKTHLLTCKSCRHRLANVQISGCGER